MNFGQYISQIFESFKVSEGELLTRAEETKPTDTEKMTNNHFGLHFKRLLYRKQLSEGLLRNNLEKEFVRQWMYKNNFAYRNSSGRKYLSDDILGKQATDEELLTINTVIQWLGTNGGIDFIQSVIPNAIIKLPE